MFGVVSVGLVFSTTVPVPVTPSDKLAAEGLALLIAPLALIAVKKLLDDPVSDTTRQLSAFGTVTARSVPVVLADRTKCAFLVVSEGSAKNRVTAGAVVALATEP